MGHRLEGQLSRGHRQQELKPRGKAGRETILGAQSPGTFLSSPGAQAAALGWGQRAGGRGRRRRREETGRRRGAGRACAPGHLRGEARGAAAAETRQRPDSTMQPAALGLGDSSLHRYLDGEFWSLKNELRGLLGGCPLFRPRYASPRAPRIAPRAGRAGVCVLRPKTGPSRPDEDGLPAPVLWTPPSRRLRGPQEASSAQRAPSYTESRDERARPAAADGMLGPERQLLNRFPDLFLESPTLGVTPCWERGQKTGLERAWSAPRATVSESGAEQRYPGSCLQRSAGVFLAQGWTGSARVRIWLLTCCGLPGAWRSPGVRQGG